LIVIRGLEIELLWMDEHAAEYRLRAGNGRYAGEADFYDNHESFSRIASCFRGFPETADDQREIELGTFNPDHGGGGVHVRLSLVDRAGHAVASVRLRSETSDGSSAEFSFQVDAAGIDRFVTHLDGLTAEVGSRANLGEAP
jgi:hypothetical protein